MQAYTPEGQAIVVAVDNPVGLEGYMQVGLSTGCTIPASWQLSRC
jgi:hypothetical protein